VSEISSITSGAGSARVTAPAPGVVLVVFAGFLEEALYTALRKVADAELAGAEHLHAFFDSENVTGFEPAFRQKMMVWQASTRGRITQHILLRSKMLAAAIALANRITGGGAAITSSRARWERELADAVTAKLTTSDRVVRLE
jgi:hypothetical protein